MESTIASSNIFRSFASIIEKLPASMFLLRAYNTALRLAKKQYHAKTYFGFTMLCDPGDLIQHRILHFGVWEPNVTAVIEQLLAPGDVCVDIGANIGYDTLLASYLVGPSGKVISIEASPTIFEMLQNNVQANLLQNVRLVNKAVSETPGTANIFPGPNGNLGRTSIIPKDNFQSESAVEAMPLDRILTSYELSITKLIKIDIEGAEVPVMRRFLDTIDLFCDDLHLIVEASPSAEWNEIFEGMRGAGFQAFAIHNDYSRSYYLHNRRNLVPLTLLQKVPEKQMDVLFTKGMPPQLRNCRW